MDRQHELSSSCNFFVRVDELLFAPRLDRRCAGRFTAVLGIARREHRRTFAWGAVIAPALRISTPVGEYQICGGAGCDRGPDRLESALAAVVP
jgi:hypothetical protein